MDGEGLHLQPDGKSMMLILSISSLLLLDLLVFGVFVFANTVVLLALSLLLPKFHLISEFYYIKYLLHSSQGCIPLPGI